MDGHVVVATNGAGVHPVDLVLVDAPVAETGEGLLEGDPALEPGEENRRAADLDPRSLDMVGLYGLQYVRPGGSRAQETVRPAGGRVATPVCGVGPRV